MTKKELRRTMKARNLSLGAEARSVASARIFGTGGVAERWRAAGKRLVLPRVEGDAMRFCDCDPAALRRGAFGIAEPEPGARTCPPGEIDLVVVPGVAFTAGGVRLGRGKGYYDRYLSQAEFRGATVGVCYAHQLVGELPSEPHDVAVDCVVAE